MLQPVCVVLMLKKSAMIPMTDRSPPTIPPERDILAQADTKNASARREANNKTEERKRFDTMNLTAARI